MATKVLMIEDDMAMRDVVVHKLESEGYQVAQAVDGKDGLLKIDEFSPDIILLDLMLPEIDGFGVLEQLRGHSDKTKAATPVIVLSNLWSDIDILKTKTQHIQAYMVKAYSTPQDIEAKIKEVMSNPTQVMNM